jgi:hypothetical protein
MDINQLTEQFSRMSVLDGPRKHWVKKLLKAPSRLQSPDARCRHLITQPQRCSSSVLPTLLPFNGICLNVILVALNEAKSAVVGFNALQLVK